MKPLDETRIESAFSLFSRLTKKDEEPAPSESVDVKSKLLDYSKPDHCIYCGTKMTRSLCCDQPVYVCFEDRYVAPLSNEELQSEGL